MTENNALRTGVSWAPAFGEKHRAPAAAFLPTTGVPEFLPDSAWDVGDRVLCLYDALQHVARTLPITQVADFAPADRNDLLRFHDETFVRAQLGAPGSEPGPLGAAGLLAVGAIRELTRRVWSRQLSNAYALVRPAGHHAEPGSPGGGCLFANGVLAAIEAKRLGARRVLFVDWDAHHGNSQQGAFWSDPSVLTVSVHQGRKFPALTGDVDARGEGAGFGANINVPVPPGSGGGVYREVFERIVEPAAALFRPDFVIVASGLDASYIDPSARLSLHSGDYEWMTSRMVATADRYAAGRLLMTHEGGYALGYLSLCFVRILEALTGERTGIDDPFLDRWGTDFAAAVSAEAEDVVARCAGFLRDVPHPAHQGVK